MARPFRVAGVASSWEPSSSGEVSNRKYSLLPSARPSVFLRLSPRSKYTYVQVVFRDTVLHSIVRDKALPWWRKEIFGFLGEENLIRLDGGYNVERFCILIAWNFRRLYLYSGMCRVFCSNFAPYFFDAFHLQVARKGRIKRELWKKGFKEEARREKGLNSIFEIPSPPNCKGGIKKGRFSNNYP